MRYKDFSIEEICFIENYYKAKTKQIEVANRLNRSKGAISKLYNYFKQGNTAFKYFIRDEKNRSNTGRNKIIFNETKKEFIYEKLKLGWNPEIIVAKAENNLNRS